MLSRGLGTAALLLLLAGPVGPGYAQAPQPAVPPDAGQQDRSDKAVHSPSGKSGTEEPSSHAPTAPPQDSAPFVNGRLAGMTQETDTAPAKFSEKNAADDKLITTAYTFKALPDDQRQAIYRALKDEPPVANVTAEIGTVLPVAIELRAMPERVASEVPLTQGYQFAVSDHRVLLVAPANRIVVAVFPDAGDVTTGAGERVR